MSLSPNEDIMGFELEESADIDDGQGSSGISENLILPSHDGASVQSFNDTISLNSDTLQDFGSIVSLPPGTLSALFRSAAEIDIGDADRTIVSSAPSGAHIPPPEASQDVWAISPHPNFAPDRAHSIPTVCTDTISYQDLLGDTASRNSSDASETSRENNAIVRTPTSRQSSLSTDGHDPVTFRAVANNLMRESVNGGEWYTRFTEYDWEQFRSVAKMILTALEPKAKLLPLPPAPPSIPDSNDATSLEVDSDSISASTRLGDILPSNFVCPLCNDVIVGARTLDCGCASSNVCSSCWEEHNENARKMSDQMNYVWIDRKNCPSCHAPVNTSVPCHALDVAILQIVQDLSDGDKALKRLKHKYYARLEAWRSTVLDRNSARSRQETERHDKLLARLIQEEENMMWEKQQCQEQALTNTARTFLFFGQTAIALVVASVASFGLKLLVSNRR